MTSRLWVALAIACASIVGSSCLFATDPLITIDYENNTPALLCLYHGTAQSPRTYGGDCVDKIEPMKTTTSGRECTGGLDVSGTGIVLIEESTREVIYARHEICQDWLDAGARVVIDRRDGEYVVTDGFPDPTVGP